MNKNKLIKELRNQLIKIPQGTYNVGYDDFSANSVKHDDILTDRILTSTRKNFSTKGFYIMDFPVTNIQFEALMPKHKRSKYGESPNHPVVEVTYYEVLHFCKEVGFRLPSEEEWEISSRAKKNLPLSQSAEFDLEKVNFWPSKEGINKKGDFPSNDYGLYDMCGNIYEYTSTYLTKNKGEEIIVIRGGSWGNCKYGSLISMRSFNDPLIRNSRIGFRLCLDKL